MARTEKEKLKSVKITKEFRRTYSDKNYGSVTVGTGYAMELEIESQEELENASKRLAKRVRRETMEDLDEFLTLKESGETL